MKFEVVIIGEKKKKGQEGEEGNKKVADKETSPFLLFVLYYILIQSKLVNKTPLS